MTTVLKFNNGTKPAFSNLFESFLKDIPSVANENRFNPQVNITETKDAFILDLNAPGRAKEEFSINLDKNLLKISHQPKEVKSEEQVKTIIKEFTTNAFSRTFTVDEKLVADNISAKYENGILRVTLPKKEEVKVMPKQISIQ